MFHKERVISVMLLLVATSCCWDPNAGLVKSLTKLPGVKATSSFFSAEADVGKVIDDSYSSHWTSGACLPAGFVKIPENNILYGLCARDQCEYSESSDIAEATDGDPSYTVASVRAINSEAKLIIHLSVAEHIKVLSVWGIYRNTTSLSYSDENNVEHVLQSFNSSHNYKQFSFFNIPVTQKVSRIQLVSSDNFQVKEVAAIGENGCRSKIIVDLGKSHAIGSIRTRHYAGKGTTESIKMKLSTDGTLWNFVTNLDPNAQRLITTTVSPPAQARFIQLEYILLLKNHYKAYCWEIDAFDDNSIWGEKIVPIPQQNTIRFVLGVNAVWGWGHGKYSKFLQSGEGPDLYNKIASHGRMYHNLDWDVKDPDNDPGFPNMANEGTDAKWWLDWDEEYKVWRNANLEVDATVQFINFQQSKWNTPKKSAYYYGKEFATHFGPEIGNGYIGTVEVGNEPWHYDAAFYKELLKAMAAGVRSVDRKINVLPGAFYAHTNLDTHNYIGTRIDSESAANISVLNFHVYSYITNTSGVRVATFPEHPESTFNSLRNMIRWRNANLPNHPVWVTEWGWDSDGAGESCDFPECVSEEEQSIYGIRGLFVLIRSAVEKVTWFFYANTECNDPLYCRSGLTSSKDKNFTRKALFYGFESLLDIMGESFFHAVLQEDDMGYIYLFAKYQAHEMRNSKQAMLRSATYIVAWKPASLDDAIMSRHIITLPVGTYPISAHVFTGTKDAIRSIYIEFDQCTQELVLNLSPYPTVIELVHVSDKNFLGK